MHYGRAEKIHAERARVLDAAHARTPERFVSRPPRSPALPIAAWINKPDAEEAAHQIRATTVSFGLTGSVLLQVQHQGVALQAGKVERTTVTSSHKELSHGWRQLLLLMAKILAMAATSGDMHTLVRTGARGQSHELVRGGRTLYACLRGSARPSVEQRGLAS